MFFTIRLMLMAYRYLLCIFDCHENNRIVYTFSTYVLITCFVNVFDPMKAY